MKVLMSCKECGLPLAVANGRGVFFNGNKFKVEEGSGVCHCGTRYYFLIGHLTREKDRAIMPSGAGMTVNTRSAKLPL